MSCGAATHAAEQLLIQIALFFVLYRVHGGNLARQKIMPRPALDMVPLLVGGLAFGIAQGRRQPVPSRREQNRRGLANDAKSEIQQSIHMDLESDTGYVSAPRWVARRRSSAGSSPSWPDGASGSSRPCRSSSSPHGWRARAVAPAWPQAISLTLFIYIVFDQLLAIPWPQTRSASCSLPSGVSFRACDRNGHISGTWAR
jgi:hypothetical protein